MNKYFLPEDCGTVAISIDPNVLYSLFKLRSLVRAWVRAEEEFAEEYRRLPIDGHEFVFLPRGGPADIAAEKSQKAKAELDAFCFKTFGKG